jgi:glycosyltransferase involved in cell wall biosynthesis
LKIAVIHDWLVTYAGAERALEQILTLYPDADLFSLVDFLTDQQRAFILHKKASTSFIQKLPFARKRYRSYLPLMPLAIEQFDLSSYDLVISSSYAVAKGVLTNAGQLHVCYCYSPMRYAWDLHHQYLRETGLNRGIRGFIAQTVLHYMRMWDYIAANRVDHYLAISRYVAGRIRKTYNREATVIYPPVDTDTFVPLEGGKDYYLTASRMVPYKKIDLIAEAFSGMPDKKLIIIGEGPDFQKIRSKAGRNIELIGYQPAPVMKEYMQKARAFVYAADEDFGIVAVEAQACGTPVIAYGKGGSLETVIPLGNAEHSSPTGVFYSEQTIESLQNAVFLFEKNQDEFQGKHIRQNALRFNEARFKKEFKDFIDRALKQHLSKKA